MIRRRYRNGPQVVVIGGGLSGIFVSLLLAHGGARVTLLERKPKIAGGWWSLEKHYDLDEGLRVPALSEISWANEVIFGISKNNRHEMLSWNILPRPVTEGQVISHRLVIGTAVPDARYALSPQELKMAKDEMIRRATTTDPAHQAESLAARLMCVFGPTLAEKVFFPSVRAIAGHDPSELSWRAVDNRLPLRVVLAEKEETDHLMACGFLSNRLGHPSAAEAKDYVGPQYVYPRFSGIHSWTQALSERLMKLNVTLLTGVSINRSVCEGARLAKLHLSTGEILKADVFILAGPIGSLRIDNEQRTSEIRSRSLGVLHLTFEGEEPPHKMIWFSSYDPTSVIHRGAFTDRLRGRSAVNSEFRMVLETRDVSSAPHAIAEELVELGVISKQNRLRCAFNAGLVGFPVETKALWHEHERQLGSLRAISNLFLTHGCTGGNIVVPLAVSDAVRIAQQVLC